MKRIASILAFLLFAIAAHAESPMQAVKDSTEKVLLLLKDPKLQGDSKTPERRQLVRAEMDSRFEWDEISRACLGRHWAELPPDAKAEFVNVFSEFLKERFSDKIVTQCNDLEKVDYKEAQIIDNSAATVRLVLTTRTKVEYSIEYSMKKASSGDRWIVDDVVIEGGSLLKLYKDQLDEIIAKFTYEGLLKRIKSKLSAVAINL